MYIPPNATNLPTDSIIRLGLQSAPGKGKTWSALTFPNPIVINFDNNLQAFAGRTDIKQVPFWDDKFVDSICKRSLKGNQPSPRPNRKDASLKWLEEHGPQLTDEQTLVVDSWSRLQDGFDIQEDYFPTRNAQGAIDTFAYWKNKITFSREICELLGTLKCHVVVTFHEQFLTDEAGKVMYNKIQPLMQGKFVNKLPSYFSDWFRCYYLPKGTDLMRDTSFRETLIDSGIIPAGTTQLKADIGLWQTKSDLVGDCKSRVPGCPAFIQAHYGVLVDLYSKSQQKNLAPGNVLAATIKT